MASISCESNVDNLINHIVFVIDSSGSMRGMEESVINVFNGQISYLSARSQELQQETRASVYTFSSNVECIIYDKDVMRLPSLEGRYTTGGGTALLDGTAKAMDDLEHTSQLYGDHAFLIYVITDGEENSSRTTVGQMRTRLSAMRANWTLAVLVPDQQGVFEAKKFGFIPNNIQIWDTNKAGIVEAGNNIRAATEAFLTSRAQGVRGTTNLFQLDTTDLTVDNVRGALDELQSSSYTIYDVGEASSIKLFMENATGKNFVKGSAFYQLSKREKIQGDKKLFVRDKQTGKVYGGKNSRQLLHLPDTEVFVKPSEHVTFDIFIESKSVNRKIVPGTCVLHVY